MAVIIIGAGPVGAYTAKIIGEAGIKVKVYEKDAKDKVKINVNIIHFDVQDYIPWPTQLQNPTVLYRYV